MASCRLTLLGGFAFADSGGAGLALPTRKDRFLLAYLALSDGKAQNRERLAALLWGDRGETQARDSLRQSLAALRQVFRQAGLDSLRAERDTVALDLAGVVVDAVVFAHLAAADPVAAIPLYGGELLDGYEGLTPECDAWLGPERERLNALAARSLEQIAESDAAPEDGAAAIRLGRRLLAQDGLREPVARALMRLLARSGERVEALKVYGAARGNLQRELGVTPDARTEALYRDILTDRTDGPAAASARGDAQPERPTVAVLPLDNLSGDATLDPLCDGLTEDIITGLGRFRLLFVIDRHSSAVVAGAGVDIAEIGRRLGVEFLVQGSLRRHGERVRITVRLVNAVSRAQLWGGNFDEPLADILALPERVTGAIVSTLYGRVENSVMSQTRRKPTLAAYECLLRGIKQFRGYGPDANDRAVALFQQAVDLDPDYSLARLYLAFATVMAHGGYDTGPDHLWDAALAAGNAAVEADGDDGRCHWLLGSIYGRYGDAEREARHYQRAVELNPNDASAIACVGISHAVMGRFDEGIEQIRLAMRLNPYHPEWYWDSLGIVFYLAQRYADAVEAFSRRGEKGRYVLPRLAAALAQLGRMDEAARVVEELRLRHPDFSLGKLRLDDWRPAHAELFREGMRKAGLPE